ncbi:MAG: hypothetical protein ACRBN8_18545 [Nannocystales bacterium]
MLSLLDGGKVVAGFSLAAVLLIAEVILAVVHRTKPQRQPTVDILEGTVEFVAFEDDEEPRQSEAPHARWFVGEQRLHVPPHWQHLLAHGERVRVRIARPPGERLAFVLGIDGRANVDFERSRGLPPAPAEQPVLLLLALTTGLIVVPGLLIGAAQFAFGDSKPAEGLAALSAVAAGEHIGTLAEVERVGLPEQGTVTIRDATVLPREWVVDPPAEAAWAVLSSEGRDRLTTMLETKHGRKAGGIPKPDEESEPVALGPADILLWRRAELHETRSPTGRPGDQVLVWLGRHKPLELVRTQTDPGAPPLVRAREQAENLAFATGSLLLAMCVFPVFLLTFGAIVWARSARARFRARALRTYGVT